MKTLGDANNKSATYSPNLKGLLDLGSSNYRSLKRLLPQISVRNEQEFMTGYHHNNLPIILKFEVVERCKYTTTLEVFETSPISTLLPCTKLRVRMYHDAEIAEVVAKAKKQIMRGAYSYPNSKMLQVDEKNQCNLFLEQWLHYCFHYGLAKESDLAEGRIRG